jgi:hypothetical protein
VQSCQGGFGRAVVGELRGAEMGEHAGHGYDGAVAGADHAREEGLESVEGAEDVDAEGFLDFGEGETEEGFAVYDGSVVDQDCGGSKLLGRLVY